MMDQKAYVPREIVFFLLTPAIIAATGAIGNFLLIVLFYAYSGTLSEFLKALCIGGSFISFVGMLYVLTLRGQYSWNG